MNNKSRDELEGEIRKRSEQLSNVNDALLAEPLEHKSTEKTLQEIEQNYRELVENANSIILRMDAQGNITFFNEFAQKFFGYTEQEILGRNVVGAIVPETESSGRNLTKMIRDILEYPERYVRNENEGMLRNGKRVWILWTSKALTDDRGMIQGFLWIGNDITDRKNAEDALRLDESRLEALFELSQLQEMSTRKISNFVLQKLVDLTRSEAGWIGFMDESERVLTLQAISRNAREQFDISDEPFRLHMEEAGLWANAVRERKAIVVNDYSSQASKKGAPLGHIALSRFMSIPVYEGDKIVAVAAVCNKSEGYDDSDVRQLSLLMDGVWKIIQRKRSLRALREAENLSAMGRSLAGVAHDMKTPLIAIGGFARLVREHMEKENPDRDKLDIVIAETRRMEKMVRDMLDFARPLEIEPALEDINRVITESIEIVESVAHERRVEVLEHLSPDIPLIAVDPMRMKQVIINLLMNAVQASPEGETVMISSCHRHAHLIIDVVDQGSGIPDEKKGEIFYPFISSKKQGTGLGLSIVKKIVDAHKGEVKILDNPERGITFRVLIPYL